MSLPVGDWSWRNRWTHSDEKHRLPFQIGPIPPPQPTNLQSASSTPSTSSSSATTSSAASTSASFAATKPAGALPSSSSATSTATTTTAPEKKPAELVKLTRYTHPNEMPSSMYTESFKVHPPQRKVAIGSRANKAATQGLSSEDRSFLMWSRINPSFFVVPFESEAKANLTGHQEYLNMVDPGRHEPSKPLK